MIAGVDLSFARSLARASLDLIFRRGHREQRVASPNAMQKPSYRRETRTSFVARDLTHEIPRDVVLRFARNKIAISRGGNRSRHRLVIFRIRGGEKRARK